MQLLLVEIHACIIQLRIILTFYIRLYKYGRSSDLFKQSAGSKSFPSPFLILANNYKSQSSRSHLRNEILPNSHACMDWWTSHNVRRGWSWKWATCTPLDPWNWKLKGRLSIQRVKTREKEPNFEKPFKHKIDYVRWK